MGDSEFKRLFEKIGLSQVEVAKLLEKSQKQVSNYINGKTKADNYIIDRMYRIANKEAFCKEDLISNNETSDNQITIPFYKDFAVSAGFGATNFEGDVELIPFNKNELRAMFGLTSFNKVGIVSVIGDSMYPTLKEWQMLIFQDDGSSIEGGIYIIEYQNEVFVKRLKKRPLSLVSDNKEYSSIEVKDLEELRIIGRVIGAYEIIYKRM